MDPTESSQQPAGQGWDDVPEIRYATESLEEAYRLLRRDFAYHPHVRIIPVNGRPPDQYQIDYRLRTAVLDESGQIEYTELCSMHLWVPPGFPQAPPLVRPMHNVFHPNVAPEGVAIGQWAGDTAGLSELVAYIGHLLAYQSIDAQAVVNPAAMEWANANPDLLPLDASADLAIDAGGQALARISRFGQRTLRQLRTHLKDACDRLLTSEADASPEGLLPLCQRVREGLALFLERDVPGELAGGAAELDEWATQLPASGAAWADIRARRSSIAAALESVGTLRDLEQAVAGEVAVAQQSPAGGGEQSAEAQLPSLDWLQMHESGLMGVIARTEQVVRAARSSFNHAAVSLPSAAARFTGLLHDRLAAETARTEQLLHSAQRQFSSVLSGTSRAMKLARSYAAAFQYLRQWRELTDMMEQGRELANRISAWGAAGVQAVFITLDGSMSGPFEMESKLPISDVHVAARNPSSSALEVISTETGDVLASSEQGTATLALAGLGGGGAHAIAVQFTGNCDELAVQLEYLIRHSAELMEGLAAAPAAPEGWISDLIQRLSAGDRLDRVLADYRSVAQQWTELASDLRALSPFKHRLATFRMLQRTAAMLPHLVERLSAARRAAAQAEDRLATIAGACQADPATGQLLIPEKLAGEYADLLARRGRLMQEVVEAEGQLERTGAEVRARVDQPSLLGEASLPEAGVLPNWPAAWSDMPAILGDAAIAKRVRDLEKVVNTAIKARR